MAAMMIAAGAALTACDSLINDGQGDCTVHYRVPFTYTQNILNSDAFGAQVSKVNLYVFDKTGRLVLAKSESRQTTVANDYRMDVELLPGTYSMVAWCEGASPMAQHTAFAVGQGQTMADFGATLPLLTGTDGPYNNLDIAPLYYGAVADVVCVRDDYGYIDLPAIDLTKDTNLIKVVLNNVDGRQMKADDFTIAVEADNSRLDCLNNPVGNQTFASLPWAFTQISTAPEAAPESELSEMSEPSEQSEKSRAGQAVTGLMAELTIGRLVIGRKPVISVTRNTDGQKLFSFDLIEFLLMVKGHYPAIYTNQDYLDRMDTFELTFFLDDQLNWYTAGGVMINGWMVVPPQNEDL